MKKRMLLILVCGLSFAPALIAAEISFGKTPPSSIACNKSPDKSLPGSAQGSGAQTAGTTSSSAGSAK